MTEEVSSTVKTFDKTLFKKVTLGLFGLSFFERTAFFTVKYLLILVLVRDFGFGDERGALVLGAAVAAQYLLYSATGFLADKFLGLRTTLWLGICLMAPAYVVLTVFIDASMGGVVDLPTLLFPALAIQITAVVSVRLSGFNLVGRSLAEDDQRSESLYTLYYWVESLAALTATLCAGTLIPAFGWFPVFLPLVFGIVACALAVYFNRNQLRTSEMQTCGRRRSVSVGVIAIVLPITVLIILSYPPLAGIASVVFIIGLSIFIYRNRASFDAPKHKEYLLTFLIATITSVLFATAQEQQWSSLVLLADRVIDRTAFGITLHPSHFQAVVPILLVVLAPVVAAILSRGTNPPSVALRLSSLMKKISISFAFMSFCFGVLFVSTFFPGEDGRIHYAWLLAGLMLAGPAELFIYPIAFNAITANAPPKLAGTMTGIYFSCFSIAGFASGVLASLSGNTSYGQGVAEFVVNYREFLALVAIVGGTCGSLIFLFALFVRLRGVQIRRYVENRKRGLQVE